MAQPLAERTCEECGQVFQPKSPRRRFCAVVCQRRCYSRRPEVKAKNVARITKRRLERPEEYRAYRRAYRQRPHAKAKDRASGRKYRQANIEKIRAYHKQWREAHREKCRESDRQRLLNNALRDMPADPFVREILTGFFMARSEALRAAYARNRALEEALA